MASLLKLLLFYIWQLHYVIYILSEISFTHDFVLHGPLGLRPRIPHLEIVLFVIHKERTDGQGITDSSSWIIITASGALAVIITASGALVVGGVRDIYMM